MQSYIFNGPEPPVQPKITQMLPCNHGAIDPRIVQQAMLALQRGSATPMSNSDAVNIVITASDEPVAAYTDAYLQSGDAFAESPMGQAMMNKEEIVITPQDRGQYVAERAPNILSDALMNVRTQPPRYVI